MNGFQSIEKAPVERYADLSDRVLADAMAAEDVAEERGMSAFERTTCRTHRKWLHRCIGSPVHVVVVSGYRWCRDCLVDAVVTVDELTASVTVTCIRCRRPVTGIATEQIVIACRRSILLARRSHVLQRSAARSAA